MMKSSSALSACAAAVISGLIWICVVVTGVIENSQGAWSQDIRNGTVVPLSLCKMINYTIILPRFMYFVNNFGIRVSTI